MFADLLSDQLDINVVARTGKRTAEEKTMAKLRRISVNHQFLPGTPNLLRRILHLLTKLLENVTRISGKS